MPEHVLTQLLALPTTFPGMQKIPAAHVYLMGCRGFSQFCSTLRGIIEPEKFCPFCEAESARRNRKSVHQTEHWLLLENEFPHKNVLRMFLLVPKQHVASLTDLSNRDYEQIGNLLSFCDHHLGIKGGGIMFRFGDTHLNVGTIEHLHINVIEPVCGKEYRAPFAKDLHEHAQDYERMLGFRDDLVRRGGFEWLFSEAAIQ